MTKKLLLILALLAGMGSVTADISLQPQQAPKTEQAPKASLLMSLDEALTKVENAAVWFVRNKLNINKEAGARWGSNSVRKTEEIAANTYKLARHPVNTIKRFFNTVRRQLKRSPNPESRLKFAALIPACVVAWLMSLTILAKISDALCILVFFAVIAAPFLQAFYDNNLSSAELRTKNLFRRFCGWLLRHRLTVPFGYDRGSVQNTEMLLAEQAALPADADEALRTIYRKELQDALSRFKDGSEDANEALQARVAAVLA